MKLNFYLEGAGLIIGIILWCVSSRRYSIIDLKDQIYVRMVRATTFSMGLNMISFVIIRKNIFSLLALAEIGICFSFLMMVLIWVYINEYLIESIYNKNSFSYKDYIIIGMPSFLNLLSLLVNWGTHSIFDVGKVEGSIQVVFNFGYKIPYVLSIVSLILYLIILSKDFQKIKEKKQFIFFAIPFIMVLIYYLQYRFKSIAILGFGYSIILLLIYIYSYNRIVRIDHLTRLPDGTAFKKMLDYRIGMNQNMTVIMIALDDFKRLNQEYGYHNGDSFLKEIASYLEKNAPKHCLSRYEGDKFAVVFDNADMQETLPWCENVLERFEHSWKVKNLSHKMSVCITMVEYPQQAETSSEILEMLEYLNTYGKQCRKNQCIVCNEEFKAKMTRRIRITSILNEVIKEKKMYVEYQPILEVTENAFTRAEALFRLKDEYLGEIPPEEFFPIAEENGFVIEIGYILIDQVCQYIKTFVAEGRKAPIISVNFSRQQIMAEDVEQRLIEILDKYQLSTDAIALELPEKVFVMQHEAVKQQMVHLSQKGFRFYLDGFGIGFLDLSYLMELPFEIIKINKNMIKEAADKDSVYLLVSAMTAVFEENGKLILGDGIETEHLKEMADLLFMDFLQGYYFCEPVSEERAKMEFQRKQIVERLPDIDEMIASAMETEEILADLEE
ncbi:MAG: EAL domain-containing protein [Lachnospiraceae bacterium]